MKEWKGKVETVSEKKWNNVKLYSFRIEGEARWFRTGREVPPVAVGEFVQFTERNNQVSLPSITKIAAEAVTEKPAPTAEDGEKNGAAFAQSSSDVSNRIRWQEARRDACNIVVAALHTDALPWASNVAKGKKLDLLRGYIKELTVQLLEDETDGR